MADDWDDAPAPSNNIATISSQWDDEDRVQDAPAESWDEDPSDKPVKAPPVAKPKKESAKKIAEREQRMEMEARRKAAAMTSEEKRMAKQQQQELVETEDHKLTEELFMNSKEQAADVLKKNGWEERKLTTEADFNKFADDVVGKVKTSAGKNPLLIVSFLKQALKVCTDEPTVVTSDDLNNLKRVLDTVFNDMRKKESNKKKKAPKANKKGLAMGSMKDDIGASLEDDHDEYDFI